MLHLHLQKAYKIRENPPLLVDELVPAQMFHLHAFHIVDILAEKVNKVFEDRLNQNSSKGEAKNILWE